MVLLLPQFVTPAQGPTPTGDRDKSVTLGRYIDQTSGLTADDLVAYALSHNLELQAARKEMDAKLDIGV